MSEIAVIRFGSLFLASLLAGEELAVCYGVRASMATLDAIPQTQLRQALIRRLRVLVPAIFLPAVVACVMAVCLAWSDPGFGYACAGLLALLAWAAITFGGTVPINQTLLTWEPKRLPENWRSIVGQWERLDVMRCWAAVIAFACLLIAVALQSSLSK